VLGYVSRSLCFDSVGLLVYFKLGFELWIHLKENNAMKNYICIILICIVFCYSDPFHEVKRRRDRKKEVLPLIIFS
jgi:hypothetical protein